MLLVICVILGDQFQQLQDTFMEENFEEFEDNEENKFCYTEIHQKYVSS